MHSLQPDEVILASVQPLSARASAPAFGPGITCFGRGLERGVARHFAAVQWIVGEHCARLLGAARTGRDGRRDGVSWSPWGGTWAGGVAGGDRRRSRSACRGWSGDSFLNSAPPTPDALALWAIWRATVPGLLRGTSWRSPRCCCSRARGWATSWSPRRGRLGSSRSRCTTRTGVGLSERRRAAAAVWRAHRAARRAGCARRGRRRGRRDPLDRRGYRVLPRPAGLPRPAARRDRPIWRWARRSCPPCSRSPCRPLARAPTSPALAALAALAWARSSCSPTPRRHRAPRSATSRRWRRSCC